MSDEELIPQDLETLEAIAQAVEEDDDDLIDIIVRAFVGMEDESEILVVDFSLVEALSDGIASYDTIKKLSKIENISTRIEEAFTIITASYNLTAVYDRFRQICTNDLQSCMEFDYLAERMDNGSYTNETPV